MINYIVYKTTNMVNGKIYIGVHKTDNVNKFDGYYGCGMYNENSQPDITTGFPAALRKYGKENFVRETLFIYPYTEQGELDAFNKEAELVNKEFVKRKDTYNLRLGGKFASNEFAKKPIAQYSIEGKFIKKWDSITKAEEALGLTAIGAAINGISKYCGDYQWREYTDENDIEAITTKEKSVYQFDLQGNLIKSWRSASEASLTFPNSHAARAAIHNVCIKITRQAYGYYWSFKPKFEYIPYAHAVAKYDDEGNFLESYTTVKEAAAAHGVSVTNIRAAISGRQKRCRGFRWRYFYGNKDNIKALK